MQLLSILFGRRKLSSDSFLWNSSIGTLPSVAWKLASRICEAGKSTKRCQQWVHPWNSRSNRARSLLCFPKLQFPRSTLSKLLCKVVYKQMSKPLTESSRSHCSLAITVSHQSKTRTSIIFCSMSRPSFPLYLKCLLGCRYVSIDVNHNTNYYFPLERNWVMSHIFTKQ